MNMEIYKENSSLMLCGICSINRFLVYKNEEPSVTPSDATVYNDDIL